MAFRDGLFEQQRRIVQRSSRTTIRVRSFIAAVAVALTQGATTAAAQSDAAAPTRPGRPPVEVDFAIERSWLSDSFAPWTQYAVQARLPFPRQEEVRLGARRSTRFDASDHALAAGGSVRLTERTLITADSEWSPAHHVLPHWLLRVGVDRPLGGGWSMHAGIGQQSYDASRVRSARLAADRYFGEHRAGYALGLARVGTRTVANHMLTAGRTYGADNVFTLGMVFGRDAEAVGGGRVLVSGTRALFAWGVHRIGAATALTGSAGWHEQGDLYQRVHVQLGVRRGF